jgi:hypothetical protein
MYTDDDVEQPGRVSALSNNRVRSAGEDVSWDELPPDTIKAPSTRVEVERLRGEGGGPGRWQVKAAASITTKLSKR